VIKLLYLINNNLLSSLQAPFRFISPSHQMGTDYPRIE